MVPTMPRRDVVPFRFQGYVFIAPAVLAYGVFALYPAIDVFVLSFFNWNGLSDQGVFVGAANYQYTVYQDTVFWLAFRNTAIWMVLAVTIPPLIGLALALALNQSLPGRSWLRGIFYLPVVISSIAVATMWRWLFNPFFGLFGAAFQQLNLAAYEPDWLGDPKIALFSIFAAYVWQNVGYSMVLFLAGLQSVSPQLVEAARIDGAGRWQLFRFVTLPALRPTITIVLTLSLINSLKTFDLVYGMTQGGPAQATQMLALWAYLLSMQMGRVGQGSVVSVILLVVTVAVVVPYLRWSSRSERVQP